MDHCCAGTERLGKQKVVVDCSGDDEVAWERRQMTRIARQELLPLRRVGEDDGDEDGEHAPPIISSSLVPTRPDFQHTLLFRATAFLLCASVLPNCMSGFYIFMRFSILANERFLIKVCTKIKGFRGERNTQTTLYNRNAFSSYKTKEYNFY